MVPQQPTMGWRNRGPILMVIYFGKHVWCEKSWGCDIEQQHNKLHDYKQEPRKLAWCNAPRVSLKVSGKLSVHPDSWWQVHCSLQTSLLKSSPGRCCCKQLCTSNECSCYQKGARARSFCQYLSKLYWVNFCVRDPLSNRPESVWISWIWYLLGIRSW